MRSFLILALALCAASPAWAAVKPTYFDFKPVTQKMIEYQAWSNLAAASSTAVINDIQGPTSAAALTVSTGITAPDYPRTLTMIANNSTADVGTCVVTVTGTDINQNVITEDLSFAANQGSIVNSLKAFKTVTSVAFAAGCEDSPYGARWNLGIGESIGVKRCMDKAGHILHSTIDGAIEATKPAMVVDASVVSKNVANFNGTMDGSADFELFFMQNFRCVR